MAALKSRPEAPLIDFSAASKLIQAQASLTGGSRDST